MKKKSIFISCQETKVWQKDVLNVAETTTELSAGIAMNLFCQNRQDEVFGSLSCCCLLQTLKYFSCHSCSSLPLQDKAPKEEIPLENKKSSNCFENGIKLATISPEKQNLATGEWSGLGTHNIWSF